MADFKKIFDLSYLNFEKVLKFGFIDWVMKKDVLKYFVFLFLFYLVTNVCLFFVVSSIFTPLVSVSNISFGQLMGIVTYFITFMAIFVAILLIIKSIISYLLIAKGLQVAGRKSVPITFSRWIRFVILSIAQFFCVVFSLFKPKLLLIPLIGLIISIIGMVLLVLSSGIGSLGIFVAVLGVLLICLALLFVVLYFFVVIYNEIRLAFGGVTFIEKEQGIIDSLSASWGMTRNKALGLFLVFFAVGVVTIIIGGISALPVNLYVNATNSATLGAATSPVVLFLAVPSILISTYFFIVEAFILVALYGFASKSTSGKESAPVLVQQQRAKAFAKRVVRAASKAKKK